MAVEVESRPPLFERESLEASLDLILGGDARAADELARLLDIFRYALDEGLRGINEARATLAEAVEIIYVRTGAHASALRLYRLSLEGHVLPGDEPRAHRRRGRTRGAQPQRGAEPHAQQAAQRMRASRRRSAFFSTRARPCDLCARCVISFRARRVIP